jgi:hypothetical protein
MSRRLHWTPQRAEGIKQALREAQMWLDEYADREDAYGDRGTRAVMAAEFRKRYRAGDPA